MFPWPPHWTSSLPPGRSAAANTRHIRSWSVTQCKTAFDTTTSTGSASSSDATSWHQTSARFPNRARASSTIAGEASKASTRPCGTSSTSCAVTRPVPHPTSTTVASAATPVSRPRTSAAHACCGWLETSYVRASEGVVIDMK